MEKTFNECLYAALDFEMVEPYYNSKPRVVLNKASSKLMYKEFNEKEERLTNEGKKFLNNRHECFSDFLKIFNNNEVKYFNENFKEDLFNFYYEDYDRLGFDSLANTFCKRWKDTLKYEITEETIRNILYYYFFNNNSKDYYYPLQFDKYGHTLLKYERSIYEEKLKKINKEIEILIENNIPRVIYELGDDDELDDIYHNRDWISYMFCNDKIFYLKTHKVYDEYTDIAKKYFKEHITEQLIMNVMHPRNLGRLWDFDE